MSFMKRLLEELQTKASTKKRLLEEIQSNVSSIIHNTRLKRGQGGAQSSGPGWGPVRFGAQSGLGPGPGWGPYGPLWAHMGPILLKKIIILIKKSKNINKNIKVVKLEILKIKTWFWNKDLSSLDSIN